MNKAWAFQDQTAEIIYERKANRQTVTQCYIHVNLKIRFQDKIYLGRNKFCINVVSTYTQSDELWWKVVLHSRVLFTQRLCIIATAKACHFSTFVCSHSTMQWSQKRCDGTHHDFDIHVFSLVSTCLSKYVFADCFLSYRCNYNVLWLRSWRTMES